MLTSSLFKIHQSWRKLKSYKTSIVVLCAVELCDQPSRRNIYTIHIKESKIEIFNFVVLKSRMNGTKITLIADVL